MELNKVRGPDDNDELEEMEKDGEVTDLSGNKTV